MLHLAQIRNPTARAPSSAMTGAGAAVIPGIATTYALAAPRSAPGARSPPRPRRPDSGAAVDL